MMGPVQRQGVSVGNVHRTGGVRGHQGHGLAWKCRDAVLFNCHRVGMAWLFMRAIHQADFTVHARAKNQGT